MSRGPFVVIVFALSALMAQGQTNPPTETLRSAPTAEVLVVTDGWRFTVKQGTQTFRVRLLGVANPLFRQQDRAARVAWDRESKDYLDGLIKGKAVALEYDPKIGGPNQGFAAAYVTRLEDGLDVNRAVITNGYERAETKENYHRKADMLAAEQEAQKNKAGMWGEQQVGAPTDARRKAEAEKIAERHLAGGGTPPEGARELARVLSDAYFLDHIRQSPVSPGEASDVLSHAEQSPVQAIATTARAAAEPVARLMDARQRMAESGMDPQTQGMRTALFPLNAIIGALNADEAVDELPKEIITKGRPGGLMGQQIDSANQLASGSRDESKALEDIRRVWDTALLPLLRADSGPVDANAGLDARMGFLQGYAWVVIRNTRKAELRNCTIDLSLASDRGVVQHFYYFVPRLSRQGEFWPEPLLARLTMPGVVAMADERWPDHVKVRFAVWADEVRVDEREIPPGDAAAIRRGLFLAAFAAGRTYVAKDKGGNTVKTLRFVRSERVARGNGWHIIAEIKDEPLPGQTTRLEGLWADNPTQHLFERITFHPTAPQDRPAQKKHLPRQKMTVPVPKAVFPGPMGGANLVTLEWRDGQVQHLGFANSIIDRFEPVAAPPGH